jgi:hypothetical protein
MPNYAGTWTLTTQAQARGAGLWPAAPGAPTIGTATAGPASASVTFTAPANLGVPATITSYTVTSSPGGLTGTGASSPITVSGLTNGTAYTFTVTATNATGTGPASAASNSVTPVANPTYLIGSTVAITPTASGNILFSYDIVADSSLNYYVASTYQQASPNRGPQLIKYSKEGVIQWQKGLFSDFGQGYAVAIDSSDNLYIGGSLALPSSYSRSVLLKYNSSGTLQFQRTYNVTTTYNSVITSIVVDSAGNIYCSLNSNANSSGSDNNGYLMKLDSTGAVTWVKGLGTLNTNVGAINTYGIGVDSSSNVYAYGSFQPSSVQAVVVQFNSSGGNTWRVGTANTGSPTRYFSTNAGVADSSGNSVIVGSTNTGSVGEAGLIKYDNTGAITWQRRFGDATNSSVFYAVALDGSGNVYATGYYISGGRATMLVAKFNSSGTYQWHRTISNPSWDVIGRGIHASSSGDVYATGYVDNNGTRYDGPVVVFNTNGSTSYTGNFALNGFNFTLGALGSLNASAAGLTANTNNVGFFTPTVNVLTNIGTETTTTSAVQIAELGTTPVSYATQKAIFGFGFGGSGVTAVTNLVSNVGVVATDTGAVGTARQNLAAASYGSNGQAIFGYGYAGGYVGTTNLVSNTGVVAANTTGVGTARSNLAAAGYGGDKALFGYGVTSGPTAQSLTNKVSNTGVVATDTAGVGTARWDLGGVGYGTDKAIFGYGNNAAGVVLSMTNLVSNTGTVATDTTGVGTARDSVAAASYDGNKAIFGYGYTGAARVSMTNLVSSTGVVATDTTGVGSVRRWPAAAGYGGNKAIFGFGTTTGGTNTATTNLVSSTGVVATDTAAVGTAREALAAAGYALNA